MNKEEYNREPVFFCSNCLSLNTKELDNVDLVVCQECGNTDIQEDSLDNWNKLYVDQYGSLFLEEDY